MDQQWLVTFVGTVARDLERVLGAGVTQTSVEVLTKYRREFKRLAARLNQPVLERLHSHLARALDAADTYQRVRAFLDLMLLFNQFQSALSAVFPQEVKGSLVKV